MKIIFCIFVCILLAGCASYASRNSIYIKAQEAHYGFLSVKNGEIIINREMCVKGACNAR